MKTEGKHMPDLIITDAAVLFPDGAVRGGQTIEY